MEYLVFESNNEDGMFKRSHNAKVDDVQERIVFKVAVLTYLALHSTAPPHLVSQFTRVT